MTGRRALLLGIVVPGIAVAALAVLLLWPMDTSRYLSVVDSGEMTGQHGELLYAFLNEKEQWCFDRDLNDISPLLVKATVAAEDKRFYRHHGVDILAVLRACWSNVTRARVVSGASTITMQVIKNGDRPARTIPGKALQALQALRLERRVTKEQILRAYLNRVPYGMNLSGAEAGARRYFGKPARELSLAEAALLAGIPKAPARYMPLKNPERARARRDHVLARMRDEGLVTQEELRRALEEPLQPEWHPFPQTAPHLVMHFRNRVPAEKKLALTIDFAAQQRAERLLNKRLRAFGGQITNGAVIVVDVPTASVLAYIGSNDFYATPGGGQVDACRAARSPGSALKPFTYALAIEDNKLYSCETLLDDSLDYGLYKAENFDGAYTGLVSASYALSHSLNVPAVVVLDRTGPRPLQDFLVHAGMTTLTLTPEEYGLGLTLGDCQVRLSELAGVYCMLANLGEYRPLRYFATDPPPPPQRLLARGTCISLYQMLEQPLPDEWDRDLVRAAGITSRVCWKTGTSTGHHDAWAFVFNSQYVVGVWLGNNDGKPADALVGVSAALPLAAKIFRNLEPSNAPAWPDPGDDMRPVKVCAVSGLPASSWCVRTRDALFPRSQFLNRTCDMHLPGQGTVPVERWPASAKSWDLANISNPVRAANKPAHTLRQALRIMEPSDQGEFVLTGEPQADKVKLKTSLDQETELNWYLDDRFMGKSSPATPLMLSLQAGDHRLACMSQQGALDSVSFKVTDPPARLRFSKK